MGAQRKAELPQIQCPIESCHRVTVRIAAVSLLKSVSKLFIDDFADPMLKLLLGDPNARKLKRYQPIVSDINLLE